MADDLVIDYDEPWRETETFLRLLPGPRFETPPKDENGVVIRHYSTTVSRELRDHPKMRVDLSEPDDREIVAKWVCRGRRPAYVGVLLSRIEQKTQWRKRRDGKLFPVDFYRRTNDDIEYRQALSCDIEGDDVGDQFRRLSNMPLRPNDGGVEREQVNSSLLDSGEAGDGWHIPPADGWALRPASARRSSSRASGSTARRRSRTQSRFLAKGHMVTECVRACCDGIAAARCYVVLIASPLVSDGPHAIGRTGGSDDRDTPDARIRRRH